MQLLRTNPGSQMQYQLGFCFWLLTFDKAIAEQLNQFVPSPSLLLPPLPLTRPLDTHAASTTSSPSSLT